MRNCPWIIVGLALISAVPSFSYAQKSGLASAGLGYEDNVVLAPDQFAGDTDASDNFFEILGMGAITAGEPEGVEFSLKGTVYLMDYWNLNQFDLANLRAGTGLKGRAGLWDWWLEISLGRIHLDNELFEQMVTREGGFRRHLSDNLDWRFAYRHDRITGYQPYEYLSGSEDQFRLAARYRPEPWSWEGGYELTLNDRDDLNENGDFYSYSPTRHTVFAKVSSRPGQWGLSLKGEARYSRYNDPHRIADATTTREDVRYRASFRLGRELDNGWAAFGEARRTVNDSNMAGDTFTDHNYTNAYYMVGLERVF